jgi:hypothetical protein
VILMTIKAMTQTKLLYWIHPGLGMRKYNCGYSYFYEKH